MTAGSSVRAGVDAFLSSPRCANRHTRCAYTNVPDRVASQVGPGRELADAAGEEFADALGVLWGTAAASTWNRKRTAVAAWLAWCRRNSRRAPALLESAERRPEPVGATRAVDRPRSSGC